MSKFLDITGRKFGRLTAIERVKIKGIPAVWLCKCECGNYKYVKYGSLQSGNTRSCGCLHKEYAKAQFEKILQNQAAKGKLQIHGESHTRLYGVWHSMRERCGTVTHKDYSHYGGRGIKVCEEWKKYLNFRDWAMANGYDPEAPYGQCTLDRIDVNGDYCPKNCRWVNLKMQSNNRTDNKPLTYGWQTMTMRNWADKLGINYPVMKWKVGQGWPMEDIVAYAQATPKQRVQINKKVYQKITKNNGK